MGLDPNFVDPALEFTAASYVLSARARGERESTGLLSSCIVQNGPQPEELSDDGYDVYDDDVDGDYHGLSEDEDDDSHDEAHQHVDLWPPTETIRAKFAEYCEKAQNNLPLTQRYVAAIELMDTLRKSKASLDVYEGVMLWHLREKGVIYKHEGLGTAHDYINRRAMFDFLAKRYNFDPKKHNVPKLITLPGSRARAKVIVNDVEEVLQSLLSDPRIKDEDYLFFDDDPFASPPEDLDYVADLNTGLSYTETYKKLITKPGKQVLLPVPFYIDGAATGQFAHLEVTAVKFTLGIFNRKARDAPHTWRTLGYIPTINKYKSRGQRILLETGHADGILLNGGLLPGEGNIGRNKGNSAQDFHSMLGVVLEGFRELQDTGFVWDLKYKGKIYEGVEFVPFIPFIKCDTDEADKLCAKYTSRGHGVASLCRYCECPTGESDSIFADYPRKTVAKIKELVATNQREALKNLSQQNILNAWYECRFGLHNSEGVHGACPLELLHMLNLGIYKYVRDCFFDQIGKDSARSEEINALAIEIGGLFCRQSDTRLPKTKFSNGIRGGKLMGKEYTGVLLVIAAVLRSSHGRQLLSKSGGLQDPDHLQDWIMLVETLLQWEEWLKSDKMPLNDLEKARSKFRYIMFLIKKVGRRSKGMGLKLMKFHGIVHMVDDILHFGVPMEFDTGSNEAGHKPSKVASKLTQKRQELFDEQVGIRLQEIHLLAMAMLEINGLKVWNYFEGHPVYERKDPPEKQPYLGGGRYSIINDVETNKPRLSAKNKTSDTIRIEQDFVEFLALLQDKVGVGVEIRTNHHRNNRIFRANPCYGGGVWREWVVIDWGPDGELPAKLWGFVDLGRIPPQNDINYGGLAGIPPGTYAIVENATYIDDGDASELFLPIEKEVGRIEGKRVKKMKFYLADVEAIVSPLVVIPDVGGKPNAYFAVKNRHEWKDLFVSWLHEPDEFEDLVSDDDQISGSEEE